MKSFKTDDLLPLWNRLHRTAPGRFIFNRIMSMSIPYTGSIGANVVALESGSSRIEMRDRRRVRNHLDSIHAIAQANLLEYCTGLALISGLPRGARGILLGIEIDYTKKARGTLTGECQCEPPTTIEEQEVLVQGSLRDKAGDIVATAQARWLIGPARVS